ncbi:DNA-processing protein DprA [Thermoactinomyces vulgaris]|uniref:DNA-processing protein DprA n=1 Tax=Thermoactinomyces vulgaris TaxID=2026 RepID=UPI003644853D
MAGKWYFVILEKRPERITGVDFKKIFIFLQKRCWPLHAYSWLIALDHIQSVGWHTIHSLIQAGWKPQEPVPDDLLNRLTRSQVRQIVIRKVKSELTSALVEKVMRNLGKMQIQTVTFFDPAYPSLLKEIAQPPWVLYIRGDSSLLAQKSLAVVGTRKPTPYGLRATRELVTPLAERGWTIVSGMANGIDGEAHRSALRVGGKTIAVLGTGVDVIYPKNHRRLYEQLVEHGAVISEMPPGTRPHPGVFPRRNRIISGLSYGTLVVEAAEKSGSLITAGFSMEQGREVFAVPGMMTSVQSQGTLKLIQDGAKCVRQPSDILEELEGLSLTGTLPDGLHNLSPIDLNDIEEQIYGQIPLDEPIHINQLLERFDQQRAPGEIHQALVTLEMKQVIASLPGARYIRK